MGECFLYGNGGGGGLNIKEYAISVTFPVGSECTVTDGVKTFKAKTGSGGAWIFDKVYAATWTVTITKGSDTLSKAVTLSADHKTEHLDLAYAVPLFVDGVLTDAYGAFGMNATGYKPMSNAGDFNGYNLVQTITDNELQLKLSRSGTTKNQSAGIMNFHKPCDLTEIKTISLDIAEIPDGNNYVRIYQTIGNKSGDAIAKIEALHTELDVSGFTGGYFVVLTAQGSGKTIRVTDWRMVM